MIDNMGMYQGYSVEGNAELKITPEMTATPNMMPTNNQYSMCGNAPLPGIICPPIYECPQERCFHRQIVHEVPHICPINTRIINHHIYKHTYSPCYTCTEENEVSNVTDNCCGRF